MFGTGDMRGSSIAQQTLYAVHSKQAPSSVANEEEEEDGGGED